MVEETNIKEAVEEIKNADEDELNKAIEQWLESVRTQGLKIGASYISAAIFGIISKHITKKTNPSLRDYKRCMDEIIKIISVQLTKQNDSEEPIKDKDMNKETTNE